MIQVTSSFLLIISAIWQFSSCIPKTNELAAPTSQLNERGPIITGAEQTLLYLPMLKGKRVGCVVNQTSTLNKKHLVDSLLEAGVKVVSIFAPEHGFRGNADAGATIKDGIDSKTGLPIVSLYGKNKKPTAEQLKGIDVMIFDIQDVGVRFYTYISTLHYVMEACASSNIPLMVLDRPNPNGHYVDGFVLDPKFTSFVGMHPVPIVHGMTIGEYAQMINGEGWLKSVGPCTLEIVPCANYTHKSSYSLPIKPSPNLPNDIAIALYPSLCFFEGTDISVGRGTDLPFQSFGSPDLQGHLDFAFTPTSREGASDPMLKGVKCYGRNLVNTDMVEFRNQMKLELAYLIEANNILLKSGKKMITKVDFFDKLAGTDRLRKLIEAGKSESEIRSSWSSEVALYKQLRKKYILYE